MKWCFDCKEQDDKDVPAVTSIGGKDYCKPCAFLREGETGEMPTPKRESHKEPRWDTVIAPLLALPMHKSTTVSPDKGDVRQFRNNLRSILAANNKAMEFKWSLKIDGQIVRVKKVGLWGEGKGSVTHAVEVTHEKKTETIERCTVGVSQAIKQPEIQRTSDHQVSIALNSGGFLSLMFDCGNLFDLSREDRAFVFGLIDRIRNYGKDNNLQPRKQGSGEKLYPVMMTLEGLEDIYNNCMGSDEEERAERAALLAAWFRGDPAIKPPKHEGGK